MWQLGEIPHENDWEWLTLGKHSINSHLYRSLIPYSFSALSLDRWAKHGFCLFFPMFSITLIKTMLAGRRNSTPLCLGFFSVDDALHILYLVRVPPGIWPAPLPGHCWGMNWEPELKLRSITILFCWFLSPVMNSDKLRECKALVRFTCSIEKGAE